MPIGLTPKLVIPKIMAANHTAQPPTQNQKYKKKIIFSPYLCRIFKL